MIESWLKLNELPHLTPLRIKQLVEHFGNVDETVAAMPAALAAVSGLVAADFEGLRSAAMQDRVTQIRDRIDRLGAQILSLDTPTYPAALKEIHAPPPVLYVRGNCRALSGCALGFVGTRHPSNYGKEVVAALIGPLVDKRCTIVSGLAHGIDTLAHRHCLDKGGTTVAVLGCGLDVPYPKSNQALAQEITATGALVSEFAPETAPLPYNFPRRNRIISGLCAGVVVVEAGAKSGSLITAAYALQQNRDVFAVPGPIFSENSAGTFHLIKNGAIPVRSALDIIEQLEGLPRLPNLEASAKPLVRIQEELLSGEEKSLVGALSAGPQRLDQLAEKTGKDVAGIFQVLLNLELKGCIKQQAGQVYCRQ
ncbi:MAG: DNA-processing protein DprA [Chitinivibrionales bacterium]|nr:DNA-processing protein DprA [Chitinivibrionales bacterium]